MTGARGSVVCVAVDYGGTITASEARGEEDGHKPVDPAAADTIRWLHDAGLTVILASNTTSDNAARRCPALEAAGIADCFAALVLSTDVGTAKPDPRFYAAVLRAARVSVAGVRADQVVFVDNRTRYARVAAVCIGMRAVLVDQDGTEDTSPAGVPVIRHIAELPDLLEGNR